jgi:membrane protease YdiL (CAAX protease family)
MDNTKNNDYVNFSIPKIIFLCLFPGIFVLLLIILFANPSLPFKFSIQLSIVLAFLFGLVPIELSILKYFSHKENKNIKDLILFRNRTPMKIFLPSVIIIFCYVAAVMIFLPEYEKNIWKIFDFVPDWFREDKNNILDINYLWLTLILSLLIDGFMVPIVEEIYFRGFLLPRMKIFGKFAPLVNVLLFSIYHFFTPWRNISRIISLIPCTYWIWKKRDIRMGIIVHCLGNAVGWVIIIIGLLV